MDANTLYKLYKNTINNLIDIIDEFNNKSNIENILLKNQYRKFYLGILLVFIGLILYFLL